MTESKEITVSNHDANAGPAGLAEWLARRNLLVNGNERLAKATRDEQLRGVLLLIDEGEGVQSAEIISLDEPKAYTGRVQFETVDALIDYMNRHGSPARSSIYVSSCGTPTAKTPALLKAELVIDDHGPDRAGWKAWRGNLEVRLDPWAVEILARIHSEFSLDDLAAWIETNEAVFLDPPAAKMLELATSFRAHSSARFDRGRNLANGDLRFEFVEETTATAGKTGEMEIPQLVTLAFPILVDGPVVSVTCRFRFRMLDKRPAFTIFLPNLRDILRQSAEELLADLRGRAGDIPVYRGTLID
jgi:hypothetical protein